MGEQFSSPRNGDKGEDFGVKYSLQRQENERFTQYIDCDIKYTGDGEELSREKEMQKATIDFPLESFYGKRRTSLLNPIKIIVYRHISFNS